MCFDVGGVLFDVGETDGEDVAGGGDLVEPFGGDGYVFEQPVEFGGCQVAWLCPEGGSQMGDGTSGTSGVGPLPSKLCGLVGLRGFIVCRSLFACCRRVSMSCARTSVGSGCGPPGWAACRRPG